MNVKNRTLFIADNLDIMRGIDSDCIDLIYLDPPFNTKKTYKAPIGSPAEGAEFKDIWTDKDVKDGQYSEIAEGCPQIHQIILAAEHVYDRSMTTYLMAMAVRLHEMKRILKDTGSIYLHCDPTASHYLKLVMDSVFGKNNFRNEIVWSYRWASNVKRSFAKKHDTILFYSKSDDWAFNMDAVREPYTEEQLRGYKQDNQGYYTVSRGKKYYTNPYGQTAGSVFNIGIISRKAKERTGYPTQKPLALLDRIIKASSNENDVVLDPFCGCATACIAAERLNRQWIGIDISPSAEVITKLRLDEETQQIRTDTLTPSEKVTVLTEPPTRTDGTENAVQRRLPAYHVHKNQLYGIQEGFCNGCREHLKIRNLTVDHVIPKSVGGTDHIDNLQLLCQACNSTKGTGTQAQLIERLKADGIL